VGGCRIKPFEKTRSTLAEVHFRPAVHDVLATNRLRATDEMAVFGTHPYKRSSVLAWGFPDSVDDKQQPSPVAGQTPVTVRVVGRLGGDVRLVRLVLGLATG
jgi:hypothetical protein